MQKNKLDNGKPLLFNLLRQFPKAFEEVAKCSEFGHNKYKEYDKDWQGFSRVENGFMRYSNSMVRHIAEGGINDESLLDNDAHVAWNALARLEVKLRNENKDEGN